MTFLLLNQVKMFTVFLLVIHFGSQFCLPGFLKKTVFTFFLSVFLLSLLSYNSEILRLIVF